MKLFLILFTIGVVIAPLSQNKTAIGLKQIITTTPQILSLLKVYQDNDDNNVYSLDDAINLVGNFKIAETASLQQKKSLSYEKIQWYLIFFNAVDNKLIPHFDGSKYPVFLSIPTVPWGVDSVDNNRYLERVRTNQENYKIKSLQYNLRDTEKDLIWLFENELKNNQLNGVKFNKLILHTLIDRLIQYDERKLRLKQIISDLKI
jgi:hypothetical protein